MDVVGQDLRSQFPVLSGFKTSPLVSQNPQLGPLRFDPVPSSLVRLLSSPSLVFPQLSPPNLSLQRFLQTTAGVPLSAARIGPQQNEAAYSAFSHNRLRLLRCPSTGLSAAFFPTGENSDQLGFVILDAELGVQVDEDGDVFRSSKKFGHSILRILVNPVASSGKDGIIGYLMACTMYSAHWFAVRSGDKTRKFKLLYLCGKTFHSSGIAGACWSSQLPELSAVLLDNGSLFLFDLEPLLNADGDKSWDHSDIKGTRLSVSWNKLDSSDDKRPTATWLGCEFSWHPQILIVARSDAVFSLDFRSEPSTVTCVAKIEMSGTYASVEKDRFLAVSMAGPDGFHFVVASNRLLILCDVRKPLKPALQWVHSIDKPCCIDVFSLSQLRSSSRDDKHKWATESGFCILLGSFWNCEFSLFCYGAHPPSTNGGGGSKFSNMCKSFCAWELPSELSLSGRECRSGSCLVKEEFSKKDLPEWVDWRQKKDLVLGFGILGNGLSTIASESEEFGGFTVVRLMSFGKLEAQRYRASSEYVINVEEADKESALSFEDYRLDSGVEEGYKFERKFHYIKLDYLKSYLEGKLSSRLESSLKKSAHSPIEDSSNPEFHAILCEKLKRCGFTRSRSSPAISLVFDEIGMPTTVREIALKRMWSELPVGLLQLAFSSYSEFLEEHGGFRDFYHEFLPVPDLPQLPPFLLRRPSCRSNKWSQRVPRSDDSLVGPIVPLPVLSALHGLNSGSESETAEDETLGSQCDEVMQVAKEVGRAESCPEAAGDHAVRLANDKEEAWAGSQSGKKRFLLHEPGAFKPRVDDRSDMLISRLTEGEPVAGESQGSTGIDMFDDMCPIKLRFTNRPRKEFSSKELQAYRILKKQFLKRQDSFFGKKQEERPSR